MTIAASVHVANRLQKALDGLLGFLPNKTQDDGGTTPAATRR
jgi:hypothetical protein